MQQQILLITGWGGGTALLNPLQQALTAQGFRVELINIFNAADAQVMQQQVEFARQFDVIIGWSLGGQLATLLVDAIASQYAEYKTLISITSNPCFVAQADWDTAMLQATFAQFKQSFAQDPILTLKRFGFMVCQGVSSSKTDLLQLQSLVQPQPQSLLQQGLNLLENLNLVKMLKSYPGQQYHLFAEQDVLVDCKVALKLQNLAAKFLSVDVLPGSHGLPLFHANELTSKICQYLQKNPSTQV